MSQKIAIVVFGYDHDKARVAAGPGTILRCREGLAIYNQLKLQGCSPYFVLTAGRAPGVTREDQPVAMSQMMGKFLHEKGAVPYADLCWNDEAWGTNAEIVQAVKLIDGKSVEGWKTETVFLVSNRWHLRRIRVVAFGLAKSLDLPWEWRTSSAYWDMPFNWRESIKEWGKFALALVRAPFWEPAIWT